MSLKQLYQRFRNWQRNPRQYPELGSEMHYCNNCGQEYDGTFCPRCGQKARAGRITWDVVRRGVMDVWGLGGRSLPYSLWQLLWRPGYFISDYINGKWQSSFPPVKMLVLVAVVLYFVGKAIFPEYWDTLIDTDSRSITSTGWQYYVDYVSQWVENHPDWMFLLLFSLLILPTWLVFRHSPRNSRHTLPQGFFIQVFLTIEYIMWVFIISSLVKLSGIDLGYAEGSSGFEDMVIVSSLFLIPVLVLVNYKQLFGYGWWGNVWRVFFTMITPACVFFGLLLLYEIATRSYSSSSSFHGRNFKIFLFATLLVSVAGLLLSLVDIINRKLWRKRGWLRVIALPLLLVLITIGLCISIEVLQPGMLLEMLSVFVS